MHINSKCWDSSVFMIFTNAGTWCWKSALVQVCNDVQLSRCRVRWLMGIAVYSTNENWQGYFVQWLITLLVIDICKTQKTPDSFIQNRCKYLLKNSSIKQDIQQRTWKIKEEQLLYAGVIECLYCANIVGFVSHS